jgi:hypothetical protein
MSDLTENVDELNLDELLNEFNAVIEEEIDEHNLKNYFLKVRFSPTQDLLPRLSPSAKLLRFTDSFYDLPTFENSKCRSNIFYRSRKDEKIGEAMWVRQEARSLNDRSHLWMRQILCDQEIHNIRSSMKEFLTFTFERFYYTRDYNENGQEIFSMYVDRMKDPFDYSVTACKIMILEDINDLTAGKIRELVSTHCPSIRLPIYSKFAYMLQCSENFELQEALLPDDNVFDRMQNEMEHQNCSDFQIYLWNFERIVQFQNIYSRVKNSQDTIKRVNAIEEQFRNGAFKVNVAVDPSIEDFL